MATKTTGLHERPTYNKLIREIQHGEKIKLPNRDALFLRNSPYLAFLDGQGTTEMAEQQERVQKQVETEHVVREQAGGGGGGGGVAEARVKKDITTSQEKVEKMLKPVPTNTTQFFDIGDTHDADMPDAKHDWKAPELMENATSPGPPPDGKGGGRVKSGGKDRNKGKGLTNNLVNFNHQPPPPPPPPPSGASSSSSQSMHVIHHINHINHNPQINDLLTQHEVRHRANESKMQIVIAGLQHLNQGKGQAPSRPTEMMEVERAKRKAFLPPELAPTARMPPNIPPPTFTPLQPATPQINPAPVIPAPIVVPEPVRGRTRSRSAKSKADKPKEPIAVPSEPIAVPEPVRGRAVDKEEKENRTRSRSAKASAPKGEPAPKPSATKTPATKPPDTEAPMKRSKGKGEPATKTPAIKPPDAPMKYSRVKGEPKPKPPKATPPPPPTSTSIPVKPNPAFDKKGTASGRFAHGIPRDTATKKSHWESMNKQYIKEQLEMRGFKFTNKQFKGAGALTKANLLGMIYKLDKNIK